MKHNKAYWLSIVLAISFLTGLPVSAAPDAFSVPAMELTPRQGVAGQGYLIDLFMQACVKNKDHIERISQLKYLNGWHTEAMGRLPNYRINTGQAGWPEIEAQKTSSGAVCVVLWTLDPNQGVGSVQDALQKLTHSKLDGYRVTNSPTQTVFIGFGDYDQNGSPQLTLNENISEKRASFQLMLVGNW